MPSRLTGAIHASCGWIKERYVLVYEYLRQKEDMFFPYAVDYVSLLVVEDHVH